MILPIVAFGHPILRKKALDITPDYPELEQLIANMFDTMHLSDGVGLAAPQVNLSIRLIVLDASPYSEKYPHLKDFRKVLINPSIIEEWGEELSMNEGCLSIPDIHENILRKPNLRLRYQDEKFQSHEEEFDGNVARIIQHEYDHLEGILFVDKLPSIKKMILQRKLSDISKGLIKVSYRMIFPLQKKKYR
ncbi:MAG: peptide deformylase [Lentimicrobiaceae bacterium]|jgi:peptide deformylase|nr:peptide deformylase [Lentimicrobiaceae bacterium]